MASSLLKHRRAFIQGLDLIDGNKKVYKTNARRVNNKKKKPRNARVSANKMREKFGIVMPNSAKEALLLDKVNDKTKSRDAISKDMMALENMNVWNFHPPGNHMGSDCQRVPLRATFEVKEEDQRHESRHEVGGHVSNSSHLESYYSAVQSMSAQMLMTIADSYDLKVM